MSSTPHQEHTGVPSAAERVTLADPALDQWIKDGLVQVEDLLMQELSQGEAFVSDKVRHLAEAGGKRFRPMFALLASQFGPNPGDPQVIKAATVVEMTHLATLYHDDVMDEADKRRGVDSANFRWNNSVAILAGDYLLAHASRLMATLGMPTVAHFAETFGELVTGQMRETIGCTDGNHIQHYLDVVREKTGVLIASAGYLGSLHAGAPKEDVAALHRCGYAIGTVFQIVDDIIDIFSSPDQSGKNPGTDLREGVFTLPVLYALEEDTEVGQQLRELLQGPLGDDDAAVARALDLLERSTGRRKALEDVQRFVDQALAELDRLPDIPANRALRQLTEYTVSRVG